MKSLITSLVVCLLLAAGVGAHADDQLPQFTQNECRSYVAHFYISNDHDANYSYFRAQNICNALGSPNPVSYDYFKYVVSKYFSGGHSEDMATTSGVNFSKNVRTADQVTCLKGVVEDFLSQGHSEQLAFLRAQQNCQ